MAPYTYTAYGLRITSSFALPELQPADGGAPDVTIGFGDVPVSLPNPSDNGTAWQSAPGQLLLSVSGVARYLVVENREIRIHPFPGTSETEIRVFLLGSVLGALLHARQMLVLHASVIATPGGAVLLMGRSGAGKSTLLGAFLQRGYAMLADDKAGVVLNEDGVPRVMPGFPIIRLTEDAAHVLRYPVHGGERQQGLEKYVLPVARFCSTPLPLRAAYSIAVHNRADLCLEPLQRLDRFQTLNRQTYRRRFLQSAEQRQSHFRILGAVSNQARVARVLRPDHSGLIDELSARIEEDMVR